MTGEILETPDEVVLFPAVHYLSDEDDKEETIRLIREELKNKTW